MKAKILEIAGVKNEADFYKQFPDEASFMAKHGGQFRKAADAYSKYATSEYCVPSDLSKYALILFYLTKQIQIYALIMIFELIHELAHLVEHNHSARFWKLVEKIMPGYQLAEDWLHKNGEQCIF